MRSVKKRARFLTFTLRCMRKIPENNAIFQITGREEKEKGTRQFNQIEIVKFERFGHNFIFLERQLEFFR